MIFYVIEFCGMKADMDDLSRAEKVYTRSLRGERRKCRHWLGYAFK